MKRRAIAVEATAMKTAAAVETAAVTTTMSAANLGLQAVGGGFGDRNRAGTGKRQGFGALL